MDLEAIWRDNLTSDNLKLFFKTDTGKMNLNNIKIFHVNLF